MSIRRFPVRAAFGAALVWLAAGAAVSGETLAGRLSALLLRFPAETAAERDEAAAALIELGPVAVAGLCSRLADPGTADDSLVRFALEAVAVRAGRPGAEDDRRAVVAAIAAALENAGGDENRAFLISLLQRTGNEEIAAPLAPLLFHPALAGPAARALTAAGGPQAEAALLRALEGARGKPDLAIILGLGEMRARPAVPALLRLAEHRDSEIRAAALDALAGIGDQAARPVLERVRVSAPAAERAGAAFRLLRFARRQAESGRTADAAEIAAPFLSDYDAPGESHIRSVALTLYADTAGEKNAWAALREAAVSPDGKYRGKALALAAEPRPGWSAGEWLEILDESGPDIQADVIGLLARRGETAALPLLREKTRAEDGRVRREAILASVRLGGADVWEDVAELLQSGDDADIEAAARAARLLPSDFLIPRIANLLAEAPSAGQAELLAVAAERKAKVLFGIVRSMCSNGDDRVRAAALAALEQTAGGGDLAAIVALLNEERPIAEIVLLQNAAAASARREPEAPRRGGALLDALALASGPKKIDFLRPLGRIGGPAALQAVLATMEDPDPRIQAVAVHTLSLWPDESALPFLFGLIGNDADRKSRYFALQGIARLLPGAAAAPEAKLARLREALAAAVEVDEKILVLNGIAEARAPDSLETIAADLDHPQIRTAAAGAVRRLVMPAAAYEGMTGLEAAAALKKAVPLFDNEADQKAAENRARKLLVKDGFKPLFNGKDLTGWKGRAADFPAGAKMTAAERSAAQAAEDALMRAHWRVVDGALSFDGEGDRLCTVSDYGDFELFIDWKIGPGGGGCVFMRDLPRIQILDAARRPEGSGGLSGNSGSPSRPFVPADRPAGEWNTFYIRTAGERVTVDLNGIRVVDGEAMECAGERAEPVYPAGPIGLQGSGRPIEFRDILIREIPPDETGLTNSGGVI